MDIRATIFLKLFKRPLLRNLLGEEVGYETHLAMTARPRDLRMLAILGKLAGALWEISQIFLAYL
jgi:hypothetical protein